MDFFLGLSTAGSEEEGEKIGRLLVEKRLAACVNIIPAATSIFSWEGKLCKEKEVIILIKTEKGRLNKIINNIKKIHKYSVPEVIFIRIACGDKEYLDWAGNCLGKRVVMGIKKNIDKK